MLPAKLEKTTKFVYPKEPQKLVQPVLTTIKELSKSKAAELDEKPSWKILVAEVTGESYADRTLIPWFIAVVLNIA